MSGRCYNSNSRNSMWANDWVSYNLTRNDDAETVWSESQSRISDSTDHENSPTPDGANDVKERIRKLFENQSFTDVTFYPKNDRSRSISAHKAVLAVGSPLFTKMLFTDHKKDTSGIKMEVEISNLPFQAFTNIVKYLYTDEIFFENDSLVQGILDGANQFEIPSLVNRCKKYFESIELTNENVCSKMQMSNSHKIDVLKERCIEFIQKNTRQVIKSSDFLRCSPSTIRTICRLQSFNLRSEMELLEAVMGWVYTQPPEKRKQSLEPLLKCIRFLTFSVTEFGDVLKKYTNIITSDEGLKIMLYLYNPPSTPNFRELPPWCNKNTTSRCFLLDNCNAVNGAIDSNGGDSVLTGKVQFPLKPSNDQCHVVELVSLLQMKCLSGRHIIKAIRLSFGGPLSDRSVINNLSIRVHCHTSSFRVQENIQILNSETVRVEFSRPILARRGEIIDVEAEAKNIKCYRFLQFDDTCQVPLNPHFQCCVSSRPKEGKLFFIREIEYGPQDKMFLGQNVQRGRRRGKK